MTIEELKDARDAAKLEYDKLMEPAENAKQRYKTACALYNEAVLYEKIRKQVMKDLINSAGID